MKKKILNCMTNDLEEYRRLAELAAEIGATHVNVSQIEESIWQWNVNRKDPYPNWAMIQPTLFKIVVPDALKPYLPVDYAEKNLETIAKRVEILKQYGLKAYFHGSDPAYLPEQVYRDHPDWRGPRCDQPRRSRSDYYAPCIDNPEVRELFVEGYRRLCEVAPIEYFDLFTNDSGSGLCWCEGLYPGKNGPASCEKISAGTRITDFLNIVQEGAALAGVEAEVNLNHIHEVDCAGALPLLHKGQSVCNRTAENETATFNIGTFAYTNYSYPVYELPLLVRFAGELQVARRNPQSNWTITIPSVNNQECSIFLRKNFNSLGDTLVDRYQALTDTAAELVGESMAAKLVMAWDELDKTLEDVHYLMNGGHIFLLGTVHQRWLTRPFVAFPEELTAEEKSYYREFQFQAQSEEKADDMLDLQASKWISGHSGMFLTSKTFARAKSHLDQAIRLVEEIIRDSAPDASYQGDMRELKLRLRMYRCIFNNAENAIRFQTIIDSTDYSVPPEDTTEIWYEQGDIRLVNINKIVRNEIDNTHEIISILKAAKKPVLYLKATEEEESVQMFGPNLIHDLEKKIEIMENHRYEFNRLYKSYNR